MKPQINTDKHGYEMQCAGTAGDRGEEADRQTTVSCLHDRTPSLSLPYPRQTALQAPSVNAVTEMIIGCAFRVGNELGAGFLEKVYENALAFELRENGLKVQQQMPLQGRYRSVVVGNYTADILVNSSVLIELKIAEVISDVHVAQCINYLRATRLPVCLLINFGKPKLRIKRVVA